ncbi:MAG: RluA family pseudouridine synthase [Lachnospiraceae bacterium]|nr:RluA family pseudouridine synthase [Lachnospiraceae bacterium]
MKLNILFEDAHLLACYKPAGVPVQSAKVGQEDCVSILKKYFYEKNRKENGKNLQEPYLGVIHRLDQPVEGIVVFGKTPFAAGELSRQVADGSMKKWYLALCKEKLTGEKGKSCGEKCENSIHNVDNVDSLVDKSGIYEDYLLKSGKTNTSRVVPAGTAGAKLAKLEYEILKVQEGRELAKIRLLTGRHHQIRVQMASHGRPLMGDRKYHPQGVESQNVDKPLQGEDKLALCAYLLEFIHPKTKKTLHLEICPEHPLLKRAYEELE